MTDNRTGSLPLPLKAKLLQLRKLDSALYRVERLLLSTTALILLQDLVVGPLAPRRIRPCLEEKLHSQEHGKFNVEMTDSKTK